MLRIHLLILLVLLLGLSFFYNFHNIVQEPPKGCHVWRQTDCASFALNYYERDMNFFHPQMHNQLGANGEGVSEFPIIYYASAILYNLFSPDEFYLRLLNLSIFILGLIALFQLTCDVTNSYFWAYVPPLLFFSSPMLLFYGNNFLPDVPAVSFALIGWSCLYRYNSYFNNWYLAGATLAFVLAGLLKVTALISFVALSILFILHLSKTINFHHPAFLHHKKRIIALLLVAILIVVSWHVFVNYYNNLYNSKYLLIDIRPIWLSDWDGVQWTLKRFVQFWSQFMWHPITLWLIVLLTLFGFIIYFYRFKTAGFWTHLTFLTLGGVIAEFFLFFTQLVHHNYYYITYYIYAAFLFILIIRWGLIYYQKIFTSIYFKTLIILFLIVNIVYAKRFLNKQFEYFAHENPDSSFYKEEMRTYLTKIDINKNDKVISIPDNSPNRTLYFLNRHGWTSYQLYKYDASIFDKYKKKGADYLVINEDSLIDKPSIRPYTEDTLGQFHNLYFFEL